MARARVTRSPHSGLFAGGAGIVVLLLLAVAPFLVGQGNTDVLTNLFILLALASMWNVLAGYGGLVSVGQQAYIGIGAYTVLVVAQHGINAFLGIPAAVLVGTVLAVPASFLLFRLSGGYFAIATWVLAVVASLVITAIPSLGAGTGASVPGLINFNAAALINDTYWAALAVAVVSVLSIFLLMRSRLGLLLTAMRDNDLAARSVGGKVRRAKLLVYLLSAAGCAAVGAIIAISQLDVQAANVFDIQWTAYMIFAVLIGGMGTVEGPIIGSIVFIVLQQTLSQYNGWYLVLVGALAMAVAIWVRGGLWGFWTSRSSFRLFSVGYYLNGEPPEPSSGPPSPDVQEGPRRTRRIHGPVPRRN
ncbi:MAG TPA: branched-chain amino acid ABC transporter permease [Candidatus Dormibacteraeota bacterium]|nr:branched-chain amino acid ABC transporter permease [Candidatus Dormibacteraeota bacterium]